MACRLSWASTPPKNRPRTLLLGKAAAVPPSSFPAGTVSLLSLTTEARSRPHPRSRSRRRHPSVPPPGRRDGSPLSKSPGAGLAHPSFTRLHHPRFGAGERAVGRAEGTVGPEAAGGAASLRATCCPARLVPSGAGPAPPSPALSQGKAGSRGISERRFGAARPVPCSLSGALRPPACRGGGEARPRGGSGGAAGPVPSEGEAMAGVGTAGCWRRGNCLPREVFF